MVLNLCYAKESVMNERMNRQAGSNFMAGGIKNTHHLFFHEESIYEISKL